jgi:hypothetical protein
MSHTRRRRTIGSAVSAAADVLSPELVLVLPPEEAARARELLWQAPVVAATPRRTPTTPSLRGAAAFDVMCIAGTLGPLLLAVLAR